MTRFLLSFVITSITTFLLIRYQRKNQISQPQRDLKIEAHKIKKDAKLFGGAAIYLGIFISSLSILNNSYIKIILLFGTFYFIIGLVDDMLKVRAKSGQTNVIGLAGRKKIIYEILCSMVAIYIMFSFQNSNGDKIFIPYLKVFATIPAILYFLFKIFTIVGTANATNLTDGMDGLLGKNILVIFICYYIYIFTKLYVAPQGSSMLTNADLQALITFLPSVLGAILGFLIFNSYPASIFMGDCGSLMLGGILGSMTIILGIELALPIFGAIFVAETMSVIIQVSYFKYTKKKYGQGKRIFLCSPIHHHFEKKNFHEVKIVSIFTILTILFSLIALYGIL